MVLYISLNCSCKGLEIFLTVLHISLNPRWKGLEIFLTVLHISLNPRWKGLEIFLTVLHISLNCSCKGLEIFLTVLHISLNCSCKSMETFKYNIELGYFRISGNIEWAPSAWFRPVYQPQIVGEFKFLSGLQGKDCQILHPPNIPALLHNPKLSWPGYKAQNRPRY